MLFDRSVQSCLQDELRCAEEQAERAGFERDTAEVRQHRTAGGVHITSRPFTAACMRLRSFGHHVAADGTIEHGVPAQAQLSDVSAELLGSIEDRRLLTNTSTHLLATRVDAAEDAAAQVLPCEANPPLTHRRT